MGKGKRLRTARAANPKRTLTTPITPGEPSPADWARLAEDFAADDQCTVPEGVEHCHGAEVEHSDGVTECDQSDQCAAPDGLHTLGMSCALVDEPDQILSHRCPICR